MKKVFIDGRSGINLIYADTLRKMEIPLKKIPPSEMSFHDIVPAKPVFPLGCINLDVIFGTPEQFRREKVEFEVVDWPSQYHTILGRPTLAQFMVVPHYAYLKLRMPSNRGPLTVNGSFTQSENCDEEFGNLSLSFGIHEELLHIKESTDMDVPIMTQQEAPELAFDRSKDTRKVQIHLTDPTKTARISTSLPPELESTLIKFLREHWKMFAWCPSDMPGIPRELAEDELKIFPNTKPVRQAMRRYSGSRTIAMGEEINRLLYAKFIRELKEAK
jgi:hypothetical protein